MRVLFSALEAISAISPNYPPVIPYGRTMDENECCEQLSDEDRAIVALVARGLTNRDIARELHMSYQTVRNRLTRIFDLTGVTNRTQLAIGWLTSSH
jgi:DNA-binding NarL/FixJ family response regulator